MEHLQEKIAEFAKQIEGADAEKIVELAFAEFGSRVTFASSLGEEDQVLTNMIARVAPGIGIFTLDTGRLHQETYDLLSKTQKKYPQLNFKIMFPDSAAVGKMVTEKGINLFYESVDNRKSCCHVRKVEPLQRALKESDAWITGLRRAQSATRAGLAPVEWDTANGKIKISPLYKWGLDDVRDYIKKHGVDVNALHAKGFVSIGCAPCTRAIKKGEDIRSGRWWWEEPENRECGLHNNLRRSARPDRKTMFFCRANGLYKNSNRKKANTA